MGFKNALTECTHAKIYFDEPMKKHTGYSVGGTADYYVEIDSLYTLNEIITLAKKYRVQYKVLGNGTNVLVSDDGFRGIVISLKRLSDVFCKLDEVRAMAGASLEKLIKFAADHRLKGLESLAGIPATIGGAVVMNAGAFGHNISDKITSVETLCDGKIKKYSVDECKFGYRKSRFLGKKEVVVSASFKLENGEREVVLAGIKAYSDLRKSLHPLGRSCGSVFKNPKPDTAGTLIDRAGLKGFSIGGATVSDKHANFIVTTGKATALDVYSVIKHIKEKIKCEFDIQLEEEVEFVGEF